MIHEGCVQLLTVLYALEEHGPHTLCWGWIVQHSQRSHGPALPPPRGFTLHALSLTNGSCRLDWD
jgi:hypothetical protein